MFVVDDVGLQSVTSDAACCRQCGESQIFENVVNLGVALSLSSRKLLLNSKTLKCALTKFDHQILS